MRNCQICAFSDHYLIFEHSGQHCVQKIAKKKKSNHLPLLFQKIKERKRNHRPFPTCCTKLQKSLHFRLEMRGTRTQCIDEHGIIGGIFSKKLTHSLSQYLIRWVLGFSRFQWCGFYLWAFSKHFNNIWIRFCLH